MHDVYPLILTPDGDGRVTVAFPDVTGASTDGATEEEALANARDCLVAALIAHVTRRRSIPRPSPARGRPTVRLSPLVTAKLALYSAMLEQNLTNAALAERMSAPESDVERLLDLDRRSDHGRIEAALAKLGKRLEVRVSDAA